jgi:hypothetical protein
MPSAGVQKWMCDECPEPRKKRSPVRKLLPNDFVRDSGRGKMGPRQPPFEYTQNADAIRKRKERIEAPVAYLTVLSQLTVARLRVRTGMGQNPSRSVLLARFAKRSRKFNVGDEVSFILPSKRKNYLNGPVKGRVLCFPDKEKRFVALDRSSFSHRRKLLSNIEVVPCRDAWL